jgi:hypothetical protein
LGLGLVHERAAHILEPATVSYIILARHVFLMRADTTVAFQRYIAPHVKLLAGRDGGANALSSSPLTG